MESWISLQILYQPQVKELCTRKQIEALFDCSYDKFEYFGGKDKEIQRSTNVNGKQGS